MKNQYVGDVGDYGKYGLLSFLKRSGVDVGVNWYLTPNDGGSDGTHTAYLSDARMSACDPEVYALMKRTAFQAGKTIHMIEQDALFRDMRFYHEMMSFSELNWRERADARAKWHADAMRALEGAALIFADPDNGLSVTKSPTQRDAQKYILPSEIVGYYERGQQVMYYQHRSRKGAEEWREEMQRIKTFLPDARLLALSFHRWSARTYILVVHERAYGRYAQLVSDFLDTAWGTQRINGQAAFTMESAEMDSYRI